MSASRRSRKRRTARVPDRGAAATDRVAEPTEKPQAGAATPAAADIPAAANTTPAAANTTPAAANTTPAAANTTPAAADAPVSEVSEAPEAPPDDPAGNALEQRHPEQLTLPGAVGDRRSHRDDESRTRQVALGGGERLVHTTLAQPRRRSRRDVELDLEAAERQAALEALESAADEDDVVGPLTSVEPLIRSSGPLRPDVSPIELEAATRRAIDQLPGRSTRTETCPFLRSIAAGQLQYPRDVIDGRNRCAALAQPLPISRMQQGLVCLQPAHVTCPRYIRGAAFIQRGMTPSAARRELPVIAAALLLLIVAIGVAAYVLLQGGLRAAGSGVPGVGQIATPPASPVATTSPSSAPSTVPRATPRATPLPVEYRGLRPCPSPQNCFIYVVQRGDSEQRIANRFHTTVAVLRRLNPNMRDVVYPGERVRVPPPR